MKFIQNPEKLWIVGRDIKLSHYQKSLEVLLIGSIDKKILMSKKFLKKKKILFILSLFIKRKIRLRNLYLNFCWFPLLTCLK